MGLSPWAQQWLLQQWISQDGSRNAGNCCGLEGIGTHLSASLQGVSSWWKQAGRSVKASIHPWSAFMCQCWVKHMPRVLYPWEPIPALWQQTLGWSVLAPLLCKRPLLVSQKAGGYLLLFLLFQKWLFLSLFFFKFIGKTFLKKYHSKTGYCLISEVINFGFSPL